MRKGIRFITGFYFVNYTPQRKKEVIEMNRKHTLRISVVFLIIGIVTTGAIFAVARDNFTSACETCHSDTTTLSISTNATGTVTTLYL